MINENKIDPMIASRLGVEGVSGDSLTGTVEENKRVFDRLPKEIITKVNALIDYMSAHGYDDLPQAKGFKYLRLNIEKQIEVSNDGLVWTPVNRGPQGEIGSIDNLHQQILNFVRDTTNLPIASGDTLGVLFGKQQRINENLNVSQATINKFKELGMK